MKCPICGGHVVFDPDTSTYVCTRCGLVVEETVMMPGRSDYERVYPLEYTVTLSVPREEALAAAAELAAGEPPPVQHAVASILLQNRHTVPWSLVARYAGSDSRAPRVLKEIRRLASRYCPGVDPEEAADYALRHRHLWSGRSSRVLAAVFLALYAEEKGLPCRPPLTRGAEKALSQIRAALRGAAHA